jgi:peptidoglycan/xylan/chitin deacetylase (PgdA/CDA1 family)
VYGSAPSRVPGWKTARRALRWLRAQAVPHARILGYHRVAEPPSDPFGLCVGPNRFAEQLRTLRRECELLSLLELTEAIRVRRVPRRAVVVTFDDGYEDTWTAAHPVLAAERVPGTLFVATGLLGREPWWEELARQLAAAPALPARLALPVDERMLAWTADTTSRDARFARVLAAAHSELLGWPPPARDAALVALREALRCPASEPAVRGLTVAQLLELADGGVFDVGAHGVAHTPLANLSEDEQRDEIMNSKRRLEDLLGRSVRSFSYPHGSFSGRTAALVREAGFACACGSAPDAAASGSDVFALPRLWPPDLRGPAFARWLRFWAFG